MSIQNKLEIGKDEKIWQWDNNNSEIPKVDKSQKDFSYALVPATALDILKVADAYSHHPVPNRVIKNVQVIYNPTIFNGFAAQLKLLQERHANPKFAPKWDQQADSKWRKVVYDQCLELAKPYQDPDVPAVKILPLWHSTIDSASDSIYKEGYADLSINDTGFFGRGLYFTYEAEYACRYAPKHILNWISFSFPYPVIKGDMEKLTGRGHYQNYDAHYVPVVPKDPNNDKEVYCYPCDPILQTAVYTEVVVFQTLQALPAYQVELGSESEDILMSLKLTLPGEGYFHIGNKLLLKGKLQCAQPYLETAAKQGHEEAQKKLKELSVLLLEPKPQSKIMQDESPSLDDIIELEEDKSQKTWTGPEYTSLAANAIGLNAGLYFYAKCKKRSCNDHKIEKWIYVGDHKFFDLHEIQAKMNTCISCKNDYSEIDRVALSNRTGDLIMRTKIEFGNQKMLKTIFKHEGTTFIIEHCQSLRYLQINIK